MTLAAKSLTNSNESLYELLWKILNTKPNKNPYAIEHILFILKKYNILLPEKPNNCIGIQYNITVDYSLVEYKQSNTSPEMFKSLVTEKIIKKQLLFMPFKYIQGHYYVLIVWRLSKVFFVFFNKNGVHDMVASTHCCKRGLKVSSDN